MTIRDRIAFGLVGAGTGAAFAGALLLWSIAVALLVVAGLALACGVALGLTPVEPAAQEVTEAPTEAVTGEPPAVGQVRMRSRVAIVPNKSPGGIDERTETG